MSLRSFFSDLFSGFGFFRKRSAADLSGCNDDDYAWFDGYLAQDGKGNVYFSQMPFDDANRLACAGRAMQEQMSRTVQMRDKISEHLQKNRKITSASVVPTATNDGAGKARFSEAWRITREWEGKWESSPEICEEDDKKFYGCEENYQRVGEWWGTNHGLTGTYMSDFAGWNQGDKQKFIRMNSEQCGAVWKATRWSWGRFGEINKDGEPIAMLLFDWSVRRWNSLTVGRKEKSRDSSARYGLYEVLQAEYDRLLKETGRSYSNVVLTKYADILARVSNVEVGGKPLKMVRMPKAYKDKNKGMPPIDMDATLAGEMDTNSGFYIMKQEAIQLINDHPDKRRLFYLLKDKRMELDGGGMHPKYAQSIKARYNNYEWEYTKTKTEWEQANVGVHRPPPPSKTEKTHGFYI
jgi:hypothetical protein